MQSANGNTTLTFTYDPFNRRIEKECVTTNRRRTTTTTTQYVYDGEDIVLQKETVAYDSGRAFTTKTSFIHGPGIDEPLAMIEGRDTYYYHADGLGSIVAMTDDSLNIVQHYSYDSFGTPTLSDPDFIQPYTYTGREWDDETGLYFYRARYYNPSAGRFISKDPIGFNGGDVTLYGCVQNNPVNLIDPLGLRPLNDCEKKTLSPYIPQVDLDNADLHDGEVPWYLGDDFAGITRSYSANYFFE